MQYACAVLYCQLWSVWLYLIFSTLPHKRHDFRKQLNTNNVCFDFLYNSRSETFFFQRIAERDVTKNIYRASCKVPVIAVGLQSVI